MRGAPVFLNGLGSALTLPSRQLSFSLYLSLHTGGDKYIVHSILLKFAVDSNGLYGSDSMAAKVAGHDLRSLINYHNICSGITDVSICVPLCCVLDYKG